MDPNILISRARTIALDVAAGRQLYISPDALNAVDILVHERLPGLNEMIQQGRFELNRWESHVRVVAQRVAGEFEQQEVRRITTTQEVLNRVRPALAVYPYD